MRTICPRHCRVDGVPLLVALLLMSGTPAPAASAQDRTAPAADTTGPSASQGGLLSEPSFLTKVINRADSELNQSGEPKDGFYPELGNMITGSGWVSAGPGYRQHLFDGHAVVHVSGAVSWNLYKMAQGRFELPRLAKGHLTVGSQVIYQDLLQVNYFGLGNDSLKSNRSGYRLDETDVLGYATVRTTPWLSVSGRFGWIHQAELSTLTGWSVTYPNTLAVFSDATAPGLAQQPAFLHGDVSVAADTRDSAGHPTRGGLYRVTAASYADRNYGAYSFRRYEAEAAQFVPLVADTWVLAFHAWEVFSDTSSGNTVPFYLMPSLGGKNTLRGYDDFRFHDRDMQVFSAESRWELFTHLDVAVFADAGKVAPDASDLDFKQLRTSYGVGLRLHNRSSTVTRLDIGHSGEGWRFIFKVNDPFKRSTLSGGRTEVIPFVP
jgi:surface antigen Omp85-like protein